VKFTSGEECVAVCAAMGLTCGASFDDVDGACDANTTLPALGCATTGHQSDYCLCVTPGACAHGLCDAPPVSAPSCDTYPYSKASLLSERVGFGAAATGGNAIYTVTTLSGATTGAGNSGSLRRALESPESFWIVFDVEGTITFTEPVLVQSNKTVDGRGRAVHIVGHLRLEDTTNVIISDVTMSNPLEGYCTQAGDVLLLIGDGTDDPAAFTTRDIWLHHIDLGDGGDGLLDLRGASRVTVSYTRFHTHKKGLLMWQDQSGLATPGMHVTMHHNWFDRISLRGPQFVYGKLHFFNNYQDRWYEYGAGSFGGAQLYSEGNIYRARDVCSLADYALGACADPNPCGDNQPFDGRTNGLVNDWAGNGVGFTKSVGDLALTDAVLVESTPANVFDPSTYYAHTADVASETLAAQIVDESGPRVDYCAN
jgi:pectate lyase